ncbi:iron(III) transport system permease protein [Roseovarius litoreus]|jgi:iron(III) transport system permease protein|uniref:Iron(III) transport system permease protein n=1 Tax=Roseovarius litoreus TaxID=1155722 RepID=A0A1M7FNT9_9RHOB|nr:iron ABC transporter permease [Roseovarius litoreus]SHM05610.1 iron(III) transport system permease protein [Roseovarius litoreus]
MSERLLHRIAWIAVILCVAPILAAALAAFTGDLDTWRDILASVLPRYARTTLILVMIVGVSTALIGSVTAWLVTVYRFPGSRWLEVALALPLAFPAYVLAYAYTSLLDHPGPVQTLLREVTGWGPREYWFPEIRSLGGAALMLTIVLYPYVYLLARASFKQQSSNAFLVARTLGRSPFRAFLRVALPMARPAIAGGALLAVMETIADYGTVAFFNVQTFATGIYQAWFSLGDRAAAAQLSLCLLSFALLLAGLERAQRGKARTAGQGARFETMERPQLTGAAGWMATAFCLAPVALGFLIPVIMLGFMAVGSGQNLFDSRYLSLMQNSVVLAGVAAVLTVIGAVLIGFRARTRPDRRSRLMVVGAGLGYAVPGGVIAVGLMVPMAALDNLIDDVMEATFGISTGLLITGSIWLMIVAYMARFMAAALNAYDSGMATVPVHYDAIGRSLGQPGPRLLWRVHLPVARTSVLTALLIVFVDVMKELPATLILHPFNFQTLAVQAHRLASDERLSEAAVPSLVLVAFGLIPVALLCRTLGRDGAQGRRSAKLGTAIRTG